MSATSASAGERVAARHRTAIRERGHAVTRHAALPGVHIPDVQRARLLSGAVRAVDELGYAHTTVAHISSRARVSRRTFYELFANSEECFCAVLDSTLERVRAQLAQADLNGLSWRERIRGGLSMILSFFDAEPALARVCVVQSARGGGRVLERREQIASELAAIIDQGRSENARAADCPPLTAEGLVGAAVAIVHARLSRGEREPLSALTSELMGLIALPYLGVAAARGERARVVPPSSLPVPRAVNDAEAPRDGADPLQGIRMRLTYRTMRVLEVLAERPDLSNRMVGELAGVPDQGQISKLLARLERLGLLTNTGKGRPKGEANAWRLTIRGSRVTQTISAHAHNNTEVA